MFYSIHHTKKQCLVYHHEKQHNRKYKPLHAFNSSLDFFLYDLKRRENENSQLEKMQLRRSDKAKKIFLYYLDDKNKNSSNSLNLSKDEGVQKVKREIDSQDLMKVSLDANNRKVNNFFKPSKVLLNECTETSLKQLNENRTQATVRNDASESRSSSECSFDNYSARRQTLYQLSKSAKLLEDQQTAFVPPTQLDFTVTVRINVIGTSVSLPMLVLDSIDNATFLNYQSFLIGLLCKTKRTGDEEDKAIYEAREDLIIEIEKEFNKLQEVKIKAWNIKGTTKTEVKENFPPVVKGRPSASTQPETSPIDQNKASTTQPTNINGNTLVNVNSAFTVLDNTTNTIEATLASPSV